MESAAMKPVNISSRGITLTELLVASTLGLVVILAIGQVDVTRLRLSQSARVVSQNEATLALVHMVKQLEPADRVKLLSASNVQFRVPRLVTAGCTTTSPPPSCFDLADNYRWGQFKYDGNTRTIRFFDGIPPCTERDRFADISGLTVRFMDESPAPPGGVNPLPGFGGADNNVLELEVSATDPSGAMRRYTSEVTIRAGAHTNLNTNCAGGYPCDSGTGLAPSSVSSPPGEC